ncbi:hypothetical protein V5H08_18005 [Vibrio cholerae]|uniref:RipA family octameric membrane protein n=1 Tax=Vibrio cholerae TaxID=666 RepID=UPI003966AD46
MNNDEQYRKNFGIGDPDVSYSQKNKLALDYALDIRKFEIELYWKRATYFWALIAVTFAGFFGVLAAEKINDREFYAFVIANIGMVFTWSWFLVNRGSKFWQENWENHVNMLEDGVIGPLYKTTLHRPSNSPVSECKRSYRQRVIHLIDDIAEDYITGPSKISVSKVNQWVSFYTLAIWVFLGFSTLPEFNICNSVSWKHVGVFVLSVFMVFAMCRQSKSYTGNQVHRMSSRMAKVL